MSSGCGCKEVYTFPHTTYPYSALFGSSIPTFLFIVVNVFRSYNNNIIVFRRYTLHDLED